MPYIEPEVIEQARQIDLLTYLRKFEPDNVEEVKGTRNVYRTVDPVSYTHLDVYKRQHQGENGLGYSGAEAAPFEVQLSLRKI